MKRATSARPRRRGMNPSWESDDERAAPSPGKTWEHRGMEASSRGDGGGGAGGGALCRLRTSVRDPGQAKLHGALGQPLRAVRRLQRLESRGLAVARKGRSGARLARIGERAREARMQCPAVQLAQLRDDGLTEQRVPERDPVLPSSATPACTSSSAPAPSRSMSAGRARAAIRAAASCASWGIRRRRARSELASVGDGSPEASSSSSSGFPRAR